MLVGSKTRITTAVERDRSEISIMCQNPHCTHIYESAQEMAVVDLSICEKQPGLRIELGKLSCNGKTTSFNSIEPSNVAVTDTDLFKRPTAVEFFGELRQMGRIAGPMALMGTLLYMRSMISMLFLGRIGDLELAGGSLALGYANITGFSVLAGLSTGMEPICAQAYGAKRWKLMGTTLQRMILFLFVMNVPIALLWLNSVRILLFCGQEAEIVAVGHTFLMYSLPDLVAQAILNPLRIYLRSQQINHPLTYCALLSLSLHVPINFFLVHYLDLKVRGVALATAWTDFNLVLILLGYLCYSGRYRRTWEGWSFAAFREWGPLLRLAVPSGISVCLEWWWYEIIIVLSGLLINAREAVASMGILIQTTALLYIFPSSLSLGVSTRVGNELGANHPGRARNAMIVGLVCAGFVGILACAFTFSVRHAWGTMFTKDMAILSLTAQILPIIGLCELGNCPQTTGCGVLRGSARPSVGAKINCVSFYCVGMIASLALGFWFEVGFVGLWLGLLAAQATCASVMLVVLYRTNWTKQAERAKELTQSSAKVVPSGEFFDSDERNGGGDLEAAGLKEKKPDHDEKEALIAVKVAHNPPPSPPSLPPPPPHVEVKKTTLNEAAEDAEKEGLMSVKIDMANETEDDDDSHL